MANKVINDGAYLQFIFDEQTVSFAKSGITIEAGYLGIANDIAFFVEYETELPFWVGNYTTFDDPSATSAVALKDIIDAILIVRDTTISVGTSAPISPDVGDLWIDTN